MLPKFMGSPTVVSRRLGGTNLSICPRHTSANVEKIPYLTPAKNVLPCLIRENKIFYLKQENKIYPRHTSAMYLPD
jgi:hypothetical protein